MAAANIASVTPLFQQAIGARRLVVGEVKFPAEYKTEGCQVSQTQLKELGLTDGLVDCAWVVTAGKIAKNAEQPILQFNITNAEATPRGGSEKMPPAGVGEQIVAIQSYESLTTKINKEEASAGTKAGSAIATVAIIGR